MCQGKGLLPFFYPVMFSLILDFLQWDTSMHIYGFPVQDFQPNLAPLATVW